MPLKPRGENGCKYFVFAKKLPKRLIFYRAYNMDKENEHSPSEFYYLKDLESSDVETEIGFSMARVPYNKLLTNLACSSHTGEYWPSVVFVRTSLRSVRTVTTSGQYSPVRPSRSVSKRLMYFLYRGRVFKDCNSQKEKR